eukprot:scaffold300820_cov31-Tisochrysis_lutea.AAC.2
MLLTSRARARERLVVGEGRVEEAVNKEELKRKRAGIPLALPPVAPAPARAAERNCNPRSTPSRMHRPPPRRAPSRVVHHAAARAAFPAPAVRCRAVVSRPPRRRPRRAPPAVARGSCLRVGSFEAIRGTSACVCQR